MLWRALATFRPDRALADGSETSEERTLEINPDWD
jgi:hypothetical protein